MIKSYLAALGETMRKLTVDPTYPPIFEEIAGQLSLALASDGKILLAGNGGSAADCQHLAGELVVRFRADRLALPAIALTVDTSVLTACLNDFGPEMVFSRQVEAIGREGDVFWAFSTSGNSRNILTACESARQKGMKVIGFTGQDGGILSKVSHLCFQAPSNITSHIQECHIAVGHMMCLELESRLFG
ncbi:MAG: SIS domain-containing protein [Planctomycetes bacterium]|nr:SIS domain-containing protein [Planctomycetota bacterium]